MDQMELADLCGDGVIFACSNCGLGFSNQWSLKIHLVTSHPEEKHHTCNICGTKFATSVQLTSHMSVHTVSKTNSQNVVSQKEDTPVPTVPPGNILNPKPHVHNICRIALGIKSDLTRDMLETHQGGTLYGCSICGDMFSDEGNLNEHFKRCATKQSVSTVNFQESVFEKRFKQCATELSLQTRRKCTIIYGCHICGAMFAKEGNLSKHYIQCSTKPSLIAESCRSKESGLYDGSVSKNSSATQECRYDGPVVVAHDHNGYCKKVCPTSNIAFENYGLNASSLNLCEAKVKDSDISFHSEKADFIDQEVLEKKPRLVGSIMSLGEATVEGSAKEEYQEGAISFGVEQGAAALAKSLVLESAKQVVALDMEASGYVVDKTNTIDSKDSEGYISLTHVKVEVSDNSLSKTPVFDSPGLGNPGFDNTGLLASGSRITILEHAPSDPLTNTGLIKYGSSISGSVKPALKVIGLANHGLKDPALQVGNNFEDGVILSNIKHYQCDLCDMKFRRLDGFKIHALSHHADVEGSFQCCFCGEEYTNYFGALLHLITHKDYKPFNCNICGEKFRRAKGLIEHEAEHRRDNNSEKPKPTALTATETNKNSVNTRSETFEVTKIDKQIDNPRSKATAVADISGDIKQSVQNQPLRVRVYCLDFNNARFVAPTLQSSASVETQEGSSNTPDTSNNAIFVEPTLQSSASAKSPEGSSYTPDVEQLFKCSVCEKEFLHQNSLKMHMIKHRAEYSHFCSVCKKGFVLRSSLNLHMKVHDTNLGDIVEEDEKISSFKCSICQKVFPTRTQITLHLSIHTQETPFKCEICGKSFRVKGALNNHLKTHKAEKPYQCSRCGAQYFYPSQFAKHLETHRNVEFLLCGTCGIECTSVTQLTLHMKMHGDQRNHKCSECPRDFIREKDLAKHMMMHTGERDYQCEVCGKLFTQEIGLNSHMTTHTKVKPIPCDICGKRFARAGHLTLHKRVHTGEKPFPCKFCDQVFATNGNLIQHMKTHKFRCDFCEKGFSHPIILKTHIKAVHCEPENSEEQPLILPANDFVTEVNI